MQQSSKTCEIHIKLVRQPRNEFGEVPPGTKWQAEASVFVNGLHVNVPPKVGDTDTEAVLAVIADAKAVALDNGFEADMVPVLYACRTIDVGKVKAEGWARALSSSHAR